MEVFQTAKHSVVGLRGRTFDGSLTWSKWRTLLSLALVLYQGDTGLKVFFGQFYLSDSSTWVLPGCLCDRGNILYYDPAQNRLQGRDGDLIWVLDVAFV